MAASEQAVHVTRIMASRACLNPIPEGQGPNRVSILYIARDGVRPPSDRLRILASDCAAWPSFLRRHEADCHGRSSDALHEYRGRYDNGMAWRAVAFSGSSARVWERPWPCSWCL